MAFTGTRTKGIFRPTLLATACCLGTDKTERWTIEEFKTYAKPAFAEKGIRAQLGGRRNYNEILFNEKLGHSEGLASFS